MFKVPDWGDDVPNVKVNFDKKTKKNDKKAASITAKTKINKEKQYKNNSTNNLSSPQNVIKKKKRKNKQQNQTNTEAPYKKSKHVHGHQSNFVQLKQHIGEKLQKNVSPVKAQLNINTGTNGNKKKKIVYQKLDRIEKKLQSNFKDVNDKIVPKNDSEQIVPKKAKKRKKPTSNNILDSIATGVINEDVSKAKKKKTDDDFIIDEKEDFLFGHNNKVRNKKGKKKSIMEETKINTKKERLKKVLDAQIKRTPIKTSGNKLRQRMLERLKAAEFRFINEKLYTSSGSEAQELFQKDPRAFHTYHEGYQLQVKKWPVNPLDVIVKRIQKIPKTQTIADMGCGEAALSNRIAHTVRSFDLVATAPAVEVCDIAHTPLLSASMDVAVYCLALMGTDLTQYLVEANRVLKIGGHLLIAEVESRFDKVEDFTKDVERLGFKLKNLDKTHQVFFFIEFTKIRDPPVKKSKLPVLTLKPCLYKRR